ncbi:MAG: anhydro-N-acetylmuramic acid kinase [Ferruginibacter sp.]|nr:anhydro-N-acetylmuramic acid kinase [Ferruginibacter sp.]
MNKNITSLCHIVQKKQRFIIGLMSGTSLDGLDIALCKIEGFGVNTTIEIIHFTTIPYNSFFKQQVSEIFSKQQINLEKLCLLNAWIGSQHAHMINDCLKKWNISNNDVDIIASHGQTIYHAPKILHNKHEFDNATLQIGDADHIAVKTGIITISDFRQKHIAAGGEGAPLAVYGDFLIFSKKNENRIMLNIGGIANFTFLHGNLDANKMFSTDTGPGNTLMDAVIKKYFPDKFYDENAIIAKQGTVNKELLLVLKENIFFKKELPKTTGPELFNFAYLQHAQQKSNTSNLSVYDIMATLCKFTADTITEAILKAVTENDFIIYSSGGGIHNPLLMYYLKELMPNITFKTTKELNINSDAKEAALFALLANETLCGNQINFGTTAPNVSMGKISFPL